VNAGGGRGGDELLRLLVLTGGHKIDAPAFEGMIDRLAAERSWLVAHARQPLGQRWLAPSARDHFDAVLLYDIPGLELQRGDVPRPVVPDARTVDDVADLLDAGIGVVALHHALAGWPVWPGWAEALGGRFHYRPARLRGRDWPDSGYYHGRFRAEVVDAAHPVCAGVTGLELTDELYQAPVFEDDVHPLLSLTEVPPPDQYASSLDAVLQRPQRADYAHPPASALLGWTTVAGRSPVVTLLPGDGGHTFAEPAFARLLGNAVDWVASEQARAAAAAGPRPVDRTLEPTVVPVDVAG